MTHLKIEQNNSTIEQVNKSVIDKLYELITYNTLDQSSNLQGRIHTSATYQEYIDYIRAKYPDLYITSDNVYIKFADSAVENVLKNSIGDGIGVTLAQAQATTNSQINSLFNNNTNITQFDEFRFFTSVTNIPSFNNCTNLQHIQIPSSLRDISTNRINNCTSLTSIGDTSNVQTFYPNQSYFFRALRLDQTKLQSLTGTFSSQSCPLFNSDEVVTISAPGLTSLMFSQFGGKELIITSPITTIQAPTCTNLTTVVLPETCKTLDGTGFRGCTNLTQVNLQNVETFIQETLINTKVKNINLSSLKTGGNQLFANLSDLNITLPNNNWQKVGNMQYAQTMFSRAYFSSVNFEVLANYDYITKELPHFGANSPIVDVINFAKATSFFSSNQNLLDGLTSDNDNKYIKQWYSPKLLTTVDYGLGSTPYTQFNWNNRQFRCKLIYLKDITSFSNFVFGGLICDALVINNTTPPTAPINYYSDFNPYETYHLIGVNIDTWGNFEDAHDSSTPFSYQSMNNTTSTLISQNRALLGSITAIYVPDSAVNTYKTTTGWTSVADKIHPMSDLTRYATRAAWEDAGKPNIALIEEYM